jgi:hypothetical protein
VTQCDIDPSWSFIQRMMVTSIQHLPHLCRIRLCVISSRIGMDISVAGPAARPKSLREIMKEKESNERD